MAKVSNAYKLKVIAYKSATYCKQQIHGTYWTNVFSP